MIGRDDASALNQKQSKSANTGALVTMGLGAIEDTNINNVSTFASDRTFVALADNNGAIAWNIASPVNNMFLLQRTWRAQTSTAE